MPKIRQSIVRWTYNQLSLDALCEAAAEIGYFGIDVLSPDEFHIPRRFGLSCTMGFVGIGDNKAIGINRTEYHDQFEKSLREYAPVAEGAGVTNVIALCGPRAADLSDEQGAKNSIACLKRLAPIAADYGITICLEPQNSKRDHPGYLCDRVTWAVNVCQEVASSQVKLLFDIYHVQVMEGDLIETIRSNNQWFHHYHTGGNPGRHELDSSQEINYPAVMRAIVDSGFSGVVAHEYVPTLVPLESLRQAYRICSV
ncbi:MAG: TIM barrel protein [Acidobacteriaceae bacterium]